SIMSSMQKVTLALLDAANDRDPVVQEQVRKSILTLGNQQPDKVLSMCQDYLLKHPKLVVGHRVVILQTIELVVKSRIDDISYPKIKSVIQLASDEMTKSKEVVPEWQQAASNILVAVGNKYINDIMEEILGKFQPGVLPHFFVVQTLANLSDSNVYGMVPFLNAIMGTMLPMLGMTKQDNMKWVFSSALCRFSESILEYLANLDKAPDPTVRKDTFSSEIYSAYDILFNSWIQSRESKLRLTVAEALGSMSHLMAHDKLEEQLPKLLPTILGLYKKNSEHYIITKSLCQVLEASVNMGSRVLETQIDGLLLALHQQICSPVDFSNPPTVKNHNEVLRCFTILANTFPDRLMVFVLQRLENSNERNRMGSLAVLRHLINSSTSIMETKKLLILASIRQPLADHSNKVKKRVVQVISAMAHHGYLELEGGDLLVRFIIQHCALPDTYHRPPDPEEVTNEALRSMCDNTLHLFTTTVGRLTDVLWPMLLCYLTPNQYASATTPLCKSLILLANKKRAAQEASFIINFNAQGVDTHTYGHDVTDEPSPRLRVNAAFPFRCRGHGAPSLSLLNALSPNIHPKAEPLWENEIPKLLSYLEGLFKYTTVMYFLYRCIGVILQQCYNKELVRKQLQEILISTRHNDAIERTGVAMGIGLCASSHLNGTLEKLEEFGKSDAFRKASGIFGLLKDKNDVDVEKMKSTLILCYGYVALHAPEDQLLTRIDSDILQNISKNFNTKVKHIVTPLYILWFKSIIVVQKYSSYWLSSGQDHERERAVKTTAELLQFYLDNLSVKNLVTFHNLGALVGRLSPRCTDPNPEVRRAAIDCIYRLMYIQLRYEGTDCFFIAQLGLTVFLKLTLFLPLHSLCLQQLSTLLFMLFDGLVDSQSNCSRASSVILNTLLKNRGAGLQDLVPEMLEVLHNRLQVIGEEQVKVAIGQSILILATQHLQTVVNTLVAYPLPYDSWSCEMWMALGADSTLALQIMEMIIEKLNVMVPYVDKKESMLRPGLTKVATSQPLAMTCALREMMLNGQSADAVAYVFPKLFSSLLVRLGSSVGVQLPKDLNSNSIISDCKTTNKMNVINFDVCGVAVEALRILLGRAQLDAVMKPLDQEGAWDKMKDPQQHTTGVTLLSRAMAKHAGPRLPAIVEGLCPSLCNIYECQRITVTAFFSELLNHHVVTELMILDMLMNNMMERITDTCGTVRMLAVRGLGNIAVGSPEKVNKYAKELLAAMSSGMEEKDDPGKLITLEAMSGMLLENSVLASMGFLLLYGFTQRSIVMFCQENDEIRCASIMLLGNLSKFGSGEPVFKDQIHNVLVSLLLHLSDPNPQVVKACKYSMRICAPIVGSEQISAMFQNHLLEEKGLHYGEFINDLTKYLTVFSFLMSFFLSSGLVMLLQDPDPLVRVKAAEAMGHFH
uniref:Maestro heat-like repeat-containing protein family member 1 n=1 Tax=Sinocyclocheilus anshuiensis TaxID=1608454 RepID=A0A671LQ92_9TELE